MAGIADLDTQREALSTRDIQNKSVIAFVKRREMARNVTTTTSMSALSVFKKRQTHENDTLKKLSPSNTNKQVWAT